MSADGLNVIALISGGKDSFYSLLHCVRHGHRIVALANLFPVSAGDGHGNRRQEEAELSIVRPDQQTQQTQPPSLYPSDQVPYADLNSFMYQTVGHEVIPLYAQATGLPLYRQPILGGAVRHERDYDYYQASSSSPGDQNQGSAPADDETESMLPLLRAVKAHHPEANALCSGAILSTYQRTRVESVALRLGLTPLSYLWKYPVLPPPQATLPDEAQLLRDMAAAGLEARIIKVASAGLDEKHLWEMVTSETGVSRLKASLRKFGFAQGASLGEGGEFETLVVDGPEALFKKRISIPENGRLVVPEGGGSTWLMLRGARLENKARGADDNDAQLAVREPAMLDAKFQTILDSILDSSTWSGALVDSAYTELATSGLRGKLSTRAASDLDNIHWAVVADSHALGSSIQRETVNVVQKMGAFLSSHGLQSRNISSVIVVLRNMSDFPKFNEEYGKLFPNANPPSRITVSCGDSVPEGHNVVVYLTVPVAKAQVARNGLHVQSRSYWAPANIGPYSQAIETVVTVGGIPTALRNVLIAGQIPLIPASMVLPPSSAIAVQEQVVLSLQHLWRIGAEMKVQCWGSAVAYFTHQPGEDSIEECAKLAGQAWSLAHGSPDEDENEDEADGPDPWDMKYNSQYQSLGSSSATSTCSATVPDWSIYTLQQQKEPTSCIPPMFTAEIESLPRKSSVEWHAHAGIKGIEEGSVELIQFASPGVGQWRSWNLVIKTSGHIVLYTTLAKLMEDDESDMAGFSSSERQLRNAYSESLHRLLPNTEAPETLEPYLARAVTRLQRQSITLQLIKEPTSRHAQATMSDNPGSQTGAMDFRASLNRSASVLFQQQSTNDRLDEILEGGRDRANTMGQASAAEDVVAAPDETTGIVSRGSGHNYQALRMAGANHSKHSICRRTSRGLPPEGEQNDDADGGANRSWLRQRLGNLQSIELENKGSVARDHLALERTFLAWLRTSLAFASIGVAVTQLFRLNTTLSDGSGSSESATLRRLGKPLGATFLGISILTLLLGARRYFHGQEWVIKGKFPASRGTIIIVALVALAIMLVSLVVVIVIHPPENAS